MQDSLLSLPKNLKKNLTVANSPSVNLILSVKLPQTKENKTISLRGLEKTTQFTKISNPDNQLLGNKFVDNALQSIKSYLEKTVNIPVQVIKEIFEPFQFCCILYFHKSHNTPFYLSKISICIALDFSWDIFMSHQNNLSRIIILMIIKIASPTSSSSSHWKRHYFRHVHIMITSLLPRSLLHHHPRDHNDWVTKIIIIITMLSP